MQLITGKKIRRYDPFDTMNDCDWILKKIITLISLISTSWGHDELFGM